MAPTYLCMASVAVAILVHTRALRALQRRSAALRQALRDPDASGATSVPLTAAAGPPAADDDDDATKALRVAVRRACRQRRQRGEAVALVDAQTYAVACGAESAHAIDVEAVIAGDAGGE